MTLFGEGSQGGTVTIDGNVTVSGSGNRVRGARITGSLSVPGSSAGISYSRVVGPLTFEGSNGVLLNNEICGTATVAPRPSVASHRVTRNQSADVRVGSTIRQASGPRKLMLRCDRRPACRG